MTALVREGLRQLQQLLDPGTERSAGERQIGRLRTDGARQTVRVSASQGKQKLLRKKLVRLDRVDHGQALDQRPARVDAQKVPRGGLGGRALAGLQASKPDEAT